MSLNAISSTSSTSYWEELLGAATFQKASAKDDLGTKLFAGLDVDGSGDISLEESGLSQEQYDAIDADRDGIVTLAELEKALELQRAALITQMKMGGLDQVISTSQNATAAQMLLAAIMNKEPLKPAPASEGQENLASSDEAAESLLSSLGGSESSDGTGSGKQVFDAMDTNKDGIISPEELQAALGLRDALNEAAFGSTKKAAGDKGWSWETRQATAAYVLSQSAMAGAAARAFDMTA